MLTGGAGGLGLMLADTTKTVAAKASSARVTFILSFCKKKERLTINEKVFLKN